MICPSCNEEISYVNVYSEAHQHGYFKKGTNKIAYYGSAEILGDSTTEIECPNCYSSLMDEVEDE